MCVGLVRCIPVGCCDSDAVYANTVRSVTGRTNQTPARDGATASNVPRQITSTGHFLTIQRLPFAMPKHVSDYYYIFDGRSGRPVIVDRSSGVRAREASSDASPDCMPVAEYVLHQQGEAVVRAFVCWCAQQTWAPSPPPEPCQPLWDAARGVAAGASPRKLREVRSTSDEAAVLAAAVGMPHRRPHAAQLLAARSCTEPDVLAAAHDAMHMSARWAEFTHDASDAAICAMHERHLNALLDALNGSAPFQQPAFLPA